MHLEMRKNMRKKSHVSLSMYLIDNVDSVLLDEHRKAFIVGSILPDCKPSFVTTKHNMNETFAIVRTAINQCTVDSDEFKKISTAYFRKLGEITHYMADYFTYPHNDVFDGSIRQHCIYEKELKHALKDYIHSGEVYVNISLAKSFATPDELCEFVQDVHEQYLQADKSVYADCRYIVALCHVVVEGILNLLSLNRMDNMVA